MRTLESLKQCIAFLYGPPLPGGDDDVPRGTCFLVSPQPAANESATYLVTAKHVYEGLTKNDDGTNKDEPAFVRLNNPQGGVVSVKLDLDEDQWLFHDDSGVDLAVQRWGPHRLENQPVEVTSWVMQAMNPSAYTHLYEGDDVVFMGLMVAFPGERKNLVIVRNGIIALLPDEQIATKMYGPADYVVLNAQAYNGNSGSPVFRGLPREGYLGFAGILTYAYPSETERFVNTGGRSEHYYNYGVSLMTPAVKLEEILEEDTKRQRAKRSRELQGEHLGVNEPLTRRGFDEALRKVSRPDGKEVIEKRDQASSET